MKWHFTHPYKDNLDINFGQFTQIIGQNQQLKYYMWQLLMWYFDGKKYSEEDLSLFNQEEPEILSDGKVLKRKDFKVISISDIQDLLEQMSYKKGTVAFDFMKLKLDTIDVMTEVDGINDRLDRISLTVNQNLNLSIDNVTYHTESCLVTSEQLLSKYFQPYFNYQEKNIAFEFVNNETKVMFLLKMIKEKLKNDTGNILLVFKNMDDYLDYSSFIRICESITQITSEFPNFYCTIFPSNESYLYVTKETIESVTIVSDYIESLYDLDFMYERFVGRYPSNNIPTKKEFLILLQKNASYLFSDQITYVSLGISDMVAIKILNSLYQYDKKLSYPIPLVDPLEISFLKDKD
ncbi:CRISPR-associated protein Cas7 [Streptococcus equinus]|uniref:CRISPR-associated protein Csn2-St n=1 Tax=Streptococcus TaxID=1301 RepID=UPI0012F8CC70|nr:MULTISPECIES: CRISPR-associated protein Csn2-St [Streptococcus]QGX00889.1 CRISPR-associated protein Cas7 [Streptococcus ruminicola]QGX47232.1 CRISPR-associated protein Cas7 [Streptococcus equinus]